MDTILLEPQTTPFVVRVGQIACQWLCLRKIEERFNCDKQEKGDIILKEDVASHVTTILHLQRRLEGFTNRMVIEVSMP